VPRRELSEATKEELLAALRESGWDLQAAAARLGIHRTTPHDFMGRWSSPHTVRDVSEEEE
jgi:two-component system nitrogen regulation response regulator GlnG